MQQQINTVAVRGSQAGALHSTRGPACLYPVWQRILAGWNCGVGLRADPADKRTGYLPLSAGYDVPVAQLSCRLRPVARPSWPPVPPNAGGLARRPAHAVLSHGAADARRMSTWVPSLAGHPRFLFSTPW